MSIPTSILLFFSLVLCARSPAFAQAGVDDKLEALYGEAKAAEQHNDLPAAISKYQAMLALAPHDAVILNNLGVLYVKQGDYPKAASTLERALKVNSKLFTASAMLGLSLFKMGDYGRARNPLEAAVTANPKDREAEFILAQDLLRLSDFPAAVKRLEHLSQNDPQNQQFLYLLGKTYMQLSENVLGKINSIDPNSVWAHQISAELMESMKNTDGAVLEWQKAIAAAPNQPGIHYKLGDLYWSQSQWDQAAEQFRLEQTLDPNNCLVPWKLGDILLHKGTDSESALQLENQALAACPHLTDAHAVHARLLMKLHRESEALVELQAASQAAPDDSSLHFLLAQAYRAGGQSQQAQAEMRRFSELEEKSRAATAERAGEVIRNNQTSH